MPHCFSLKIRHFIDSCLSRSDLVWSMIMLVFIFNVSSCDLELKSEVKASLAQGAGRKLKIAKVDPSHPKAGETVTLTGTSFQSGSQDLLARIVLADGALKDLALTVNSDKSATFTVPTDIASELVSILIMRGEDIVGRFDMESTVGSQVEAVTFSPPGGAYTLPQSVALSSVTPGASIYYTIDGSEPTSASTLYTSGINVSSTTTIKAIATKADYTDSAVSSANYTINLTVQRPVASVLTGSYSNDQSVTLSTIPVAASIYYTLDGSAPTASSTLYTGTITINGTKTLKAVGIMSGYTNSGVMSETYTLAAANPTSNVAAGAYGPAQTVTLTSSTTGAVVRYTTDGSAPTCASATGTVSVTTSMTVRAIACKTNYSNSAEVSFAYTINGQVATPTFSVAQGTYTSAQSVTLSSTTSGASIYYTTNGSTPTSASTLYSSAISVSSTTTIKAIALKANHTDSGVSSAVYTINYPVQTPVASVLTGSYSNDQSVTLSTIPVAASIYYTLDGSAPTASSTLYTGTITINGTKTLKAVGIMSGYTNSGVMSETYTLAAANPTSNVAAGAYGPAQTVTLTSSTTGAVVRYTTDGSAPTCASATGTVSVTTSMTVRAIACKTNYSNSAEVSFAYTINGQVATPTFSVAQGTYTSAQSVTLSSTTSGASIYYTTNGSAPTSGSTLYTSAISVSATTTIKAIAIKSNYTDSGVAEAVYTINQQSGSTSDPYYYRVELLLHFNEALQYDQLTDSSPAARSAQFNAAGANPTNININTGVQSPAGGGGVLQLSAFSQYDGTPAFPVTAAGPGLNAGLGDFTLEWYWYNPDVQQGVGTFFGTTSWEIGGYRLQIRDVNVSDGQGGQVRNVTLAAQTFSQSPYGIKSIWAVDLTNYAGQWTHYAVSRIDGITKVFINGQQATLGINDAMNDPFNPFAQTAMSAADSCVWDFPSVFASHNNVTMSLFGYRWDKVSGYVDDLRYTVGVGRYTSNFTPPSGQFPDTGPAIAPADPTALVATAGDQQVALAWTAPFRNGGSVITDYAVQYSSNSGASWTTFVDGTSTGTSATVTGLTNGTTYKFRVAAVNAVGIGNYIVSSNVMPSEPIIIATQPKNDYSTSWSENVNFSVVASGGGGNLTYQWQYFGTDPNNNDYNTEWRNFTGMTSSSASLSGSLIVTNYGITDFGFTGSIKVRCAIAPLGGSSTYSHAVHFLQLDDNMHLPSPTWYGAYGTYANYGTPQTISMQPGENLVMDLSEYSAMTFDTSWYTGNDTTIKLQVATTGASDSDDWTDLYTTGIRGPIYLSGYQISPSTGTKYYRVIAVNIWPRAVNDGTSSAPHATAHMYGRSLGFNIAVTWP